MKREPATPDELPEVEVTPPPVDVRGWADASTVATHHHEAKIFRAQTNREFRINDRRHAEHERRLALVDERLRDGAQAFADIRGVISPLRPRLTTLVAFLAPVVVFVGGVIWALSRYPDASEFVAERQRVNAAIAAHEARMNAQAVEAAQQRALLERVLSQVDAIDGKIDRIRRVP